MGVNRRVFIRRSAEVTAAGVLVAGVAIAPVIRRPDPLRFGKDLWLAPVSRIELCKPGIQLVDGTIIHGDGFKSIGPPNTLKRVLGFNRINITDNWIVAGVALCNFNGSLIKASKFNGGSQRVSKGDSLVITYTLASFHGTRCRAPKHDDMRLCTCNWRTLAANHAA